MIDELLLLSGNDIPFLQAGISIHQPRLRQIAYITEEGFWPACELLKFDKEILIDQDKLNLSNMSNFNIIMIMMQEKNIESQKARVNVTSLLSLLFPTSEIHLGKETIQLYNHQTEETHEINKDNFQVLKQILIDMFCLNGDNKQYDPQGQLAKKIANQIKRGREKKAKLAPGNQKITILSRYVSILAVGEHKSINDLMDYTIYQLMDEFTRYQLKVGYDSYIQFKCAGATDMKDPEDWYKDIHNDRNNDEN